MSDNLEMGHMADQLLESTNERTCSISLDWLHELCMEIQTAQRKNQREHERHQR